MKKNFIRIFTTLLILSGGAVIHNYTGEDIVLEDGTKIESQDLSKHLTNKYRDREIDTVTIYLHHTVTSKKASIESINKIHINNGWEKLSYHIVIRHNGEINIINDFTKYTYHTKGKNKKGIAIALIGNYEIEEPSEKMIEATRNTIDVLCNMSNLHVIGIKGHRDVKATLCPGEYAYNEFKDIYF